MSSKWHFWKFGRKAGKPAPAVEYLADADALEQSPPPKFAQFTVQLLFIALITFVLWAVFSKLDLVVTAQGTLVNPLPNIVVQPLETSIIQSINVRPGQLVKKGDTLAVLDATFIRSDENQLKLRLDSLETQATGLEQELAGQDLQSKPSGSADGELQANLLSERRANFRAQKLKIDESIAKLRTALGANRRDQQLASQRLRQLKEIEGIQEKLVAQKLGAPLQLMEAQIRSKEVERELAQVVNHEQEILRDLAAYEADKTAFERGWRQKAMEELLSVTRERDALREQIQKADKRSRLITLTAPEDSVVLDIIKLSPGSIVREAETFFTLVPINVALEAEVQIDAVDVGYVKAGVPVHLKIEAFPFQRHGTLEGTVRTISEDSFRRDSANKAVGNVYYVSRVTLGGTKLKDMAEKSRLLPGMTLNAEIVVGKRSVISYLAWPILKGLNEAGREP
jgi:HlyD family secretion protein